jgi:hypothetical protein
VSILSHIYIKIAVRWTCPGRRGSRPRSSLIEHSQDLAGMLRNLQTEWSIPERWDHRFPVVWLIQFSRKGIIVATCIGSAAGGSSIR